MMSRWRRPTIAARSRGAALIVLMTIVALGVL
jgi:hypothetical protein